jgi:hypothetical protein
VQLLLESDPREKAVHALNYNKRLPFHQHTIMRQEEVRIVDLRRLLLMCMAVTRRGQGAVTGALSIA